MPNFERERSDYVYDLTEEQKVRLLDIALKKDQPIELLVLQAVDEFIEREIKSCQTKL